MHVEAKISTNKPAHFPIRDGLDTNVLLKFKNVLYGFILHGLQISQDTVLSLESLALLVKGFRTEQRANMLGTERWAQVNGRGHLIGLAMRDGKGLRSNKRVGNCHELFILKEVDVIERVVARANGERKRLNLPFL